MAHESRSSRAAFWAAIVLAVALGYPLSFGPACWISSRVASSGAFVEFTYQPLMRLWWRGEPVDSADWLARYGKVFAGDWEFFGTLSPPDGHVHYVLLPRDQFGPMLFFDESASMRTSPLDSPFEPEPDEPADVGTSVSQPAP